MPPIPTTFDDETTQTIQGIERRAHDLLDFQIPRLRTCKGPLVLQQKLAAEVREDVDRIARNIQGLELVVGDLKSSRDRAELERITDGFKATLTTIKRDSRAALLESKRTIDSMSRSNREELLSSSAVTQGTDEKSSTGDALMRATNDVTDALRRTIGIMQGELEKSVLSTQMLESSTASLRATSTTHDTLTNVMGTSKQLITALEKSDWLDRILIMAALVFFFLVVLFIVKQRVLDRGLRVAFWWTRFIPDFGGDDEVLSAMEDGVKALTSTVSSAAAITVGVASSIAPPPPPPPETETDVAEESLSKTLDITLPTPSISLEDSEDETRTLIPDDIHDEL